MIKPWMSSLLKAVFVCGILSWLILSGHLDLNKVLSVMSIKIFSLCLFVAFLNIVINGLRWWVLIRSKDFDITIKELFKLQYLGYFFNFVMPGSIGGDLVKAYYLLKENQSRKTDAATTVLMDRVIGLYVMLGMSVATVGIYWEVISRKPMLSAFASTLVVGFIGVTAIFGLGFVQDKKSLQLLAKIVTPFPQGKRVVSVFESILSYKNKTGALFIATILSIGSQLCIIANFLLVGEVALGENLSLDAYFFSVPLGMISTALPIAPAGIGIGQGVYLALFHAYTEGTSAVGQIGITVFQLALLINSLIGGYFYLTIKGKFIDKLKEVQG